MREHSEISELSEDSENPENPENPEHIRPGQISPKTPDSTRTNSIQLESTRFNPNKPE